MAKLVNLTPHAIVVAGITIPPSGQVARVTMRQWNMGLINGIPIVREIPDELVGLPEPTDGTLYIVSRVVAAAAGLRDDILVPGNPVRDDQGKIIGVENLAIPYR